MNIPTNRRAYLRLIAVTGCSLLSLASAHAQDVPDVSETVDPGEIVVTARSREERLQDVPLVINVVDSADIEKKNVKSVFDLAKLAPSFTYIATVRGQATVTMRGLSPNSLYPSRQGVGFFLDGMYLPGEVTSFNLQDLDRVEVLKGPQATHFGRSTYAGAVNYVTRVPTDDVISGRVSGEVSSFGSYDLGGIINAPLITDAVYGSFSARKYHRGGRFVERNYGEEIGQQDSVNVAANILATPWTGGTIRLRGSYDRDVDAHQLSYTLYRQDMARYDQTFPTGRTYPVFTINERDIAKLGASRAIDPTEDGGRDRDRYFIYGIFDQELGGGYTLNYSAEYFDEYNDWKADVTNRWTGDPTLTNAVQVLNPTQNSTVSYTQQLRLESPGNKPFQWMIGAFYLNEEYITYSKYGRVTLNPFSIVKNAPAQRDAPLITDNKALFFSLNYEPLAGLNLAFEARYQSEKLSVKECDAVQCQRYGAAFERTAEDFLPRATVSYKFSPNLMAYALYSEGVKSGAINLSSTATTQAAALTYQIANYQTPERNKNYEFGVKGSILDRKLAFEAAIYHMDVTNQQVATFGVNNTGQTTSFTGNGGESDIDGAELSLSGRPTRFWDVDFGIGYAHHQYVGSLATNSTLIQLYGNGTAKSTLNGLTSTQTPKWTMNGSTEYRLPMGDNQLALRADWTYMSERYVDVPNLIKLPERHNVNLSARLELGAKTRITAFVNNVFDDRDADDAGPGYGNVVEQGTANSGASPSIIINLPYGRIVGLRVARSF
jgi:iron complex outermembrane recepter protein